YWLEHLHGKPYHISAIYLVDLRRLRAIAGGDKYRLVYSRLSSDPNSLANLDQDLPNFIQDQVPIYSLPEEWLWCETWCGAESKARAKTIDLCNNPLTKMPKLDNARLIIPGWEETDTELEALSEKLLQQQKQQMS
ncbi:UDP-glucose:glycoprotein glucosyltransferase, partial [Trypanosoma cruzi]